MDMNGANHLRIAAGLAKYVALFKLSSGIFSNILNVMFVFKFLSSLKLQHYIGMDLKLKG